MSRAEAGRGSPGVCVHRKPLHLREIDCRTHPLVSRNPAGEESGEPLTAALFMFFDGPEVNAYYCSVTTGLRRTGVKQAVPRLRQAEFHLTARTSRNIALIRHAENVSRPFIGNTRLRKPEVRA